MKSARFGVTVPMLLALCTSACDKTAAQTAPKITAHHVDVELADGPKGCVVTAPKKAVHKDYKIRVRPGDLVYWTVHNACKADMDVGIGNFQAPPDHIGKKDPPSEREYPLEMGHAVTARVQKGRMALITARIKPDLKNRPRTYQYDILHFGGESPTAIADPEIEIPQ